MPVRALLRVAVVEAVAPPYNTIYLKVFYPALDATTERHYQTAVLPFDTQWSPAPIVVFLPGVNCSAHSYEWLASKLAENGIVTVISSWIAQNLPGRMSVSPGIDIDAVHVENYGKRPTSSSLSTILKVVENLKDDGVMAGNLNHEALIFGGHSAGGTMALQNARHDWFPRVKAAFAYGSNSLATGVLGQWERGKIPPLPTDVPVLMMGASLDGISEHHNKAFGHSEESNIDFLKRIFAETDYQDSSLCIFDGANHHSICYPLDTSIGRTFLDTPSKADEQAIRDDIADLIKNFIRVHVQKEQNALELLQKSPATAQFWKQV